MGWSVPTLGDKKFYISGSIQKNSKNVCLFAPESSLYLHVDSLIRVVYPRSEGENKVVVDVSTRDSCILKITQFLLSFLRDFLSLFS